jgi:single-stranded DNA-binding protein
MNVSDHLKEGMEVRCGFGHRTREFTKQDGTTGIINDIRLYKIESVRKAQNQTAPQYQTQQRPPFPPQVDQYGNPVQPINQDENDLPF